MAGAQPDRLWGAPVEAGNLPGTVTYLDRDGQVVATFGTGRG